KELQAMLRLSALLLILTLAEAEVPFTYSTIYDENDFMGVNEVGLQSCINGGCSVYVSASQEAVESIKHMFLYNAQTQLNVSLYNIYMQNNPTTWQKEGRHLSDTGYSIRNYNNAAKIGPLVVYVVASQAPYYANEQVEIYDAATMRRPSMSKKITVIMSSEPYNLFVQSYGNTLQAFVRATGFDNNFQRQSPDDCQIIVDHNEGAPFRVRLNSPIITVNFESTFNTQICASINSYNGAALDYPGIATSQGYVGCKWNNFRTYTSSIYSSISAFELKDSHGIDRMNELTYRVRTNGNDKMSYTTTFAGGTQTFDVTGDGAQLETNNQNAQVRNSSSPYSGNDVSC
ncbi:hypothetical protein PFISCL1PPCAC_13738, partial [Pristionchus fissidentatus]